MTSVPQAPPRASDGLPDPPPVVAPGPAQSVPEARQLPAHRGKLERITDDLTGLTGDLKEWVDLRIRLAKSQIEDLIDGRVSSLKGLAIAGAAAAIAGLFALVTLSLLFAVGLQQIWSGFDYWGGFLLTTLILFGVAAYVKKSFAPGKVSVERSKATGELKISHEETPAQREARKNNEEIPEHGSVHA